MMTGEDRLPWFHCFPSKLLGGMAGLNPDQKLTYVVVLLRIYEVRGPCLDTIEALSNRIGFNKRRVLEALNALFKAGKLVREGNGIMNPYAEQVLAGGEARHERRVTAGRAGGTRAAEKRKGIQTPEPSRAVASADHKDLDSEKEIDSLFPEGKRTPPSDWPVDYRERFWAGYPRKTEKKAALAKLDAIRKSGQVPWARFIAGILRHAEKMTNTEERYIKHPTTWLNKGCWDDEYRTEPPTPGGAPANPARPSSGFAAVHRDMRERRKQEEEDDADASGEDVQRALSPAYAR